MLKACLDSESGYRVLRHMYCSNPRARHHLRRCLGSLTSGFEGRVAPRVPGQPSSASDSRVPRRTTATWEPPYMKALCWHGTGDVRVDTVPDPKIEDPRDVIIKITSTAICGSDLHLFDGFMPTMEKGDMLGHEPMGKSSRSAAA